MRIFLLLAFTSFSLVSQSKTPKWSWKSDSGRFQAEAQFLSPDEPRKIFVWESASPKSKQLLCEFVRDAALLFSPDDTWIALNDHLGSNVSEIRLFKRVKNGEFKAVALDPSSKAWDLFKLRTKTPYPRALDHAYSCVVRWSANSQALLIVLSGHSDQNRYIDEWLCVFDLRTGKASLDLNLMNRDAVRFRAHNR